MQSRLHLFALLMAVGIFACAAYLITANQFCSADSPSESVAGPNINVQENKTQTDSYADYRAAQYQKVPLGNALPFYPALTVAQQQNGQAQSGSQEAKSHNWISKFFCETKIGDLAVAFFTYCLVIVGGLQARRLRQTIEHMGDTAERQLRAYVTCYAAGLGPIEPGKPLRCSYIFLNDGLTPAHGLEANAVLKLLDYPLAANTPFPALASIRPSKHNLSPRSQMNSASEPFDNVLCEGRPITQSDIIQILTASAAGKRLFAFGEITYLDAFKMKRWTRFCTSFAGDQNLLALAQQGNWQAIAHITGNLGGFAWNWELANQHNEAS